MTLLQNNNAVCWESPANIALIKYWGKRPIQIPQNPSVSITLSQSVTRTRVAYSEKTSGNENHQFFYDGKSVPSFEGKVFKYISGIKDFFPFLNSHNLTIHSTNTFPHSSGISSSASFMSSLALCLCSIAQKTDTSSIPDSDFFLWASSMARLGSGSAARSVFGGFSVWGSSPAYPGSSDEHAIGINDQIHPLFKTYRDAVLIVRSKKKSLSSSAGHLLMEHHPYANDRYQRAKETMQHLSTILLNGDQEAFVLLVEEEAMGLHGLIQSSKGGPILLEPKTISIIRAIRDFRKESGIKLCFTLDAGPNVHLLYPEAEIEPVHDLINNKLSTHCENRQWIDDHIGVGPIQIID